MSETLSLWALFLGSLLSATILPGGSEVAFLAFIKSFPHLTGPALASATLGNTLGGISSYLLGRFLPIKNKLQGLASLERYGPPPFVVILGAFVRRSAVCGCRLATPKPRGLCRVYGRG